MNHPGLVVVLAASIIIIGVSVSRAADSEKSEEIEILLKDFKFHPPASVQFPNDLFVFNKSEQKLCFYTNGPAEAKFSTPSEGEWDVIVKASGESAINAPIHGRASKDTETIPPKFQLGFDGKNFGMEVSLRSDDVRDYNFVVPLTAGEHAIKVEFTNDLYDPDNNLDINFFLHGVKLKPHRD